MFEQYQFEICNYGQKLNISITKAANWKSKKGQTFEFGFFETRGVKGQKFGSGQIFNQHLN